MKSYNVTVETPISIKEHWREIFFDLPSFLERSTFARGKSVHTTKDVRTLSVLNRRKAQSSLLGSMQKGKPMVIRYYYDLKDRRGSIKEYALDVRLNASRDLLGFQVSLVDESLSTICGRVEKKIFRLIERIRSILEVLKLKTLVKGTIMDILNKNLEKLNTRTDSQLEKIAISREVSRLILAGDFSENGDFEKYKNKEKSLEENSSSKEIKAKRKGSLSAFAESIKVAQTLENQGLLSSQVQKGLAEKSKESQGTLESLQSKEFNVEKFSWLAGETASQALSSLKSLETLKAIDHLECEKTAILTQLQQIKTPSPINGELVGRVELENLENQVNASLKQIGSSDLDTANKKAFEKKALQAREKISFALNEIEVQAVELRERLKAIESDIESTRQKVEQNQKIKGLDSALNFLNLWETPQTEEKTKAKKSTKKATA